MTTLPFLNVFNNIFIVLCSEWFIWINSLNLRNNPLRKTVVVRAQCVQDRSEKPMLSYPFYPQNSDSILISVNSVKTLLFPLQVEIAMWPCSGQWIQVEISGSGTNEDYCFTEKKGKIPTAYIVCSLTHSVVMRWKLKTFEQEDRKAQLHPPRLFGMWWGGG